MLRNTKVVPIARFGASDDPHTVSRKVTREPHDAESYVRSYPSALCLEA